MAIRRNAGIGLVVLATVAVLVGCARPAPPAATSASATSPTAAASASVSDTAYVTALPTRVLSWPDANATLRPLAQDTHSLVPASTAFAAISAGFMNVLATGAPRGQATASLYSYSNSSYGQIQADGTVTLTYTNVPVWAFLIPLSKYIDESQGPRGAKPSQVTRTHCTYYYLVDARTGAFLTSSQECKVSEPDPPE